MSAELAYVSATELVLRYRANQLSPAELTQAVLARIRELSPSLNAFCLIDEAGARAAEARWMEGAWLGWVDGVPASIKGLILSRGGRHYNRTGISVSLFNQRLEGLTCCDYSDWQRLRPHSPGQWGPARRRTRASRSSGSSPTPQAGSPIM